MSPANEARRRAEARRVRNLLPGALIALAALGAASTPMPRATQGTVITAPTKEYVQSTVANRQKKKKQDVAGGGKKPRSWLWDRKGNAIDGAGNYRSANRLRRSLLMSLSGLPKTGRQWNRLRRTLRRHAPELLLLHPREIQERVQWIRVTRSAG